MDNLDHATRLRVMSRNKSHGTKATEWKFRSLLMRFKVKGWKLGHGSGLPGKPDVVFPQTQVAIFLDGCFWHGCPRCRSIPVSNREFWLAKIEGNKKRDRKVVRQLRAMGWIAIRIWEHELKAGSEYLLGKIGIVQSFATKARKPRKPKGDRDT